METTATKTARSGKHVEVEAKVPAEQFEVLRIKRCDRGPHLPGASHDEQVVPEGRDLGLQAGILPGDRTQVDGRL